MVVFAGQGDARRSMALLWRKQLPPDARPGPKPGLDLRTIVATAIEIADADGMSALSMRAVGERLGRTAMAIYTYVPSKSELVDLMYDSALAEKPTEYPLEGGWRPALTQWCRDSWDFYARHPWILQVSQARPVLGPNEHVSLETLMRILVTTGLPAVEVRRLGEMLLHHLRGIAQAFAETRQAAKATGMSDDEWWYARSSQLDELAPDFAERFPTLTRLEAEGAYRAADETKPYLEQLALETFETGLRVVLDGIEKAAEQPSF
ncbi:TetR/AcrR family transcriptional regulator [Actinocrispum wychmicini]|uniref:TetR family transcriptional regulator n=1 Tax=Actinocrispum wychmicini TaxID=1213861 RepID=A0A4R2JY74_9PSEU|nr:TetR/AcrR family transcriptional regulator [Actinocrispum wychmicini]TCO62378.1 TetR family transcriptional regulator [Actinocrispum wychmicini]